MHTPYLLSVEDNPIDIQLMKHVIEMKLEGLAHVFVNDGEEAISFLTDQLETNTLPGLILLDIKMPKLSGIEVLEYIKSQPRLKDIPTIMLSSSDDSTDKQKSHELGCIDYIEKPRNFVDLKKVIPALVYRYLLKK